jgi:hypothetical protein
MNKVVMMQALSRVEQEGDEADISAEMPRIGCDRSQGHRGGLE